MAPVGVACLAAEMPTEINDADDDWKPLSRAWQSLPLGDHSDYNGSEKQKRDERAKSPSKVEEETWGPERIETNNSVLLL